MTPCQLCDERPAEAHLIDVDVADTGWSLCRPCLWINTLENGSAASQVRGIEAPPSRVATDGERFYALRAPPCSLGDTLASWRVLSPVHSIVAYEAGSGGAPASARIDVVPSVAANGGPRGPP